MSIFEISKFSGGIADFEDRGIAGSFKFGANLDIRKQVDSLSCQQALVDEGIDDRSPSSSISASPSTTASSSASSSVSPSLSQSPSSSASKSPSPSTGISDSISLSPSASASPSSSVSPSHSVSPSPSLSKEISTVFRDLIRFFVNASNGYTYGFGNTGYIYRRDSDGVWIVVYKDEKGAIKGAEEKPSSGANYLVWATDVTVKRKDLSGRSDWNDVEIVQSNLESSDWHTMKQVAGSVMIANNEKIAMIGYDDSYTNEALNLIPGNIARTITERDGRSIIGTARKGDLTRGINAAIDCEVPLAQVGEDGELFYADMVNTVPVKSFPGGGKVNPGGVTNLVSQVNFFEWEQDALSWIDKQTVGNLSMWAVYNATTGKGGIYSYGRKNKNHSFVLNLDYQFDADELGALTNAEGTLLVSYRDGTDFGVKAVDSTAKATGIYEGLDFKSPIRKPSNISNWKYAEVYCNPLTAGSIEFWYRLDKNGDFVQAKMQGEVTDFDSTGEKKAVFLIGAEGEIFEPKIILNPSGNTSPSVYRVRVYFE